MDDPRTAESGRGLPVAAAPAPPATWVDAPAPRRTTAGRLIEAIKVAAIGLLGLIVVALILAVLAVLLALLGTLTSATESIGGIGGRLDRAIASAGSVAASAGQRVTDALDPTHPPREGVVLDTEIDGYRRLSPGDPIGEGDGFRYTLRDIRVRDNATSPADRQYAVIQRERVTPQPRSLIGVPLPPDRGEAEYILDRGELFQIGPTLSKVNWISATRREVGLTTIRQPDQAVGPIEFRSGAAGPR